MCRKIVAVVGSAEVDCDAGPYCAAFALGKGLVDRGFRVLSGGLGGVMEAVLAGGRASERYQEGDTLAVVPEFDADSANAYADIVIASGLDVHMNGLVASVDAVVAVGGGAGTLCEVAAAMEAKKPVVLFQRFGGCSSLVSELAEKLESTATVYSTDDVSAAFDWLITFYGQR